LGGRQQPIGAELHRRKLGISRGHGHEFLFSHRSRHSGLGQSNGIRELHTHRCGFFPTICRQRARPEFLLRSDLRGRELEPDRSAQLLFDPPWEHGRLPRADPAKCPDCVGSETDVSARRADHGRRDRLLRLVLCVRQPRRLGRHAFLLPSDGHLGGNLVWQLDPGAGFRPDG
jgi:hypothetical protein